MKTGSSTSEISLLNTGVRLGGSAREADAMAPSSVSAPMAAALPALFMVNSLAACHHTPKRQATLHASKIQALEPKAPSEFDYLNHDRETSSALFC
jgi:hypothetical protein